MKRALHGPIGALFAPPRPRAGPSAADLRAEEEKAKDEAARKSRAAAAARQGNRASLLTDAGLAEEFGANETRRRTLLGG